MTWLGFAGVFALFFATHSIPVRPPVRAALVARLGSRGFVLCYSALSVAMLAILIMAAGRAPYVQLWPRAIWQNHVVIAGMVGVCVILAFSLGRPNPFSFGGMNNHRFDPANPGIVRWLRHPVLAALALWAALHLLPNGDLAHVLLFGVFAAFALLGQRLIDRRKKREMGVETWQRLRQQIKEAPGPEASAQGIRGLNGILVAAALFAAIVLLHPVVIGVRVY